MTQSTLRTIPRMPTASATENKPGLGLRVRWSALGVLMTALLVLFVARLAVGSVQIPVDEVFSILVGGEASHASWGTIIRDHRLPRALTAVLAGAALSVSGLMMQTLFRNPLAGPYVLGISSGASLGVALVVLSTGTVGGTLIAGIGLGGDLTIAMAAGLGAGFTMLIVVLIASKTNSSMTLLILGLMFGYMTSALVSLLLYFSIPEQIQAYIRWTFGSFGGVSWQEMRILGPTVMFGLLASLTLSKPLNALLLGETYASSMGMRVFRVQIYVVILTALLTGVVTAFCGPIGFIGIAVPHVCRSVFNSSDHRVLIPATMLTGALTALFAEMIAQMPGSQIILPLNPVTALIGAPVVIWVIVRGRNLQKAFSG